MTAKTERAIALRDHALAIVQGQGQRQPVGGVNVLVWKAEPWVITYRTPFQKMPEGVAAPSHHHAVIREEAPKPLPYGLDLWHGAKVLSIEWDTGTVNVITFKRGPWEDELLAL